MIKIGSRNFSTGSMAIISVGLILTAIPITVTAPAPAQGKPSGESVAVYKKGLALMQEQKCREAIPIFSRVIKLDPDSPLCYYQRGRAQLSCDAYDQAQGDIDRAILLDPNMAAAYFARAQIYTAKSQIKLAIASCDKAIALAKGHAACQWWSERGAMHEMNGEMAKALSDFAEAIRISPNDDSSYLRRGKVEYQLCRYKEAIKDVTNGMKAAGTPDSHYRMYDIRAKCYDKIGRHDLALKDRKVLEKEVGVDWGKP